MSTHLRMPPSCAPQRGGLRAAAKALAAPTEAEAGLTVDADVVEEAARQRERCTAYLQRQAGGGGRQGRGARVRQAAVLPAQEALREAGSPKAAPEGAADVALAERPFSVEMFGLRKVYKVCLLVSPRVRCPAAGHNGRSGSLSTALRGKLG